jgi:cyclohexadieny/prephenate dehydrogenase
MWQPGAIITDVGSVKGADRPRLWSAHVPPHAHFIPGHPIAGTEQSGPRSGFAELFQNRWCILTPRPRAIRQTAGCALEALWTGFGSKVETHGVLTTMTSCSP